MIKNPAKSAHRTFFRAFLSDPGVVGAIAPSSERLANTLLRPFSQSEKPARLLEVGAGTGAVTKCIPPFIGPDDHVSVCELIPELANHLNQHVLTRPDFAPHVAADRVELLPCPVQDIQGENQFDYIVSCLPFTAFPPDLIRDIFKVFRRILRPGGVLSYFEYAGMRRLRTVCAVGKTRRKMRTVSAILDDNIRQSQFAKNTVVRNFPPALVRHCRLE